MASKVLLSVRKCQCLLKTLSLRHNSAKISSYNMILGRHALWRQYSTSPQESSAEPVAENEEDPEELLEIEKKRDVSRLPLLMKNRLEHSLHAPEPNPYIRNQFRAKRKIYSYYGKVSGIDPTVAWPTKEELEEEIEFEQEFEPSLQERWAALQAKKDAELERRRLTEETVEKQMAKMPEYIAQFRGKIEKAEAAERAQEEKRKVLMEEARDYFGYHIDYRDSRFKEMQERKAEEELKMKKKKKREEKELRLESVIQRMQMESKKAKEKMEEESK